MCPVRTSLGVLLHTNPIRLRVITLSNFSSLIKDEWHTSVAQEVRIILIAISLEMGGLHSDRAYIVHLGPRRTSIWTCRCQIAQDKLAGILPLGVLSELPLDDHSTKLSSYPSPSCPRCPLRAACSSPKANRALGNMVRNP